MQESMSLISTNVLRILGASYKMPECEPVICRLDGVTLLYSKITFNFCDTPINFIFKSNA